MFKLTTRTAAGLEQRAATDADAMADAELDGTVGGLNPQPLPPSARFLNPQPLPPQQLGRSPLRFTLPSLNTHFTLFH